RCSRWARSRPARQPPRGAVPGCGAGCPVAGPRRPVVAAPAGSAAGHPARDGSQPQMVLPIPVSGCNRYHCSRQASVSPMKQRTLGSPGLAVSALGYGCMGLSQGYGPANDTESIRTLHRAIELGVTFLDTAMSYGVGHNERLLGRALAG